MGWKVLTVTVSDNGHSVVVEEFGSQASACEYIRQHMRRPGWSVVYVYPSIVCDGRPVRVCLPDGCIGGARTCSDIAWLVSEAASQSRDAAARFIRELFASWPGRG